MEIEVEAGYDGAYSVSHWFPITVIATNNGPDIQGVLEWRYPAHDDNQIFRRGIDLPRGARKRFTLLALANNFSRTGELRLLVNENPLYRQQIRIDPMEPDQFVIAVLSSDATLLNSLSAMNFPGTSGTRIVRFNPAFLPDQAMALTGIDAIFIHDIPSADWSAEQRAALELWVRLGGQLVISGGSSGEFSIPGLSSLLPVTVDGLEGDVPLTSLNQLARSRPLPDSTTTTISRVNLQPDGKRIDQNGLLTERMLGDGRVIFSAFDLSVLRSWTEEPDLWERVLLAKTPFSPAATSRWQNVNLLSSVLQLPALSLPSTSVLVLYIAGYILVIGPLNFLILRRLKRIDLAWLTIPVTVMLFVIGTYGASFVIRGIRPQVLQATIVQSFEGGAQGQSTTFLGVFSPQRNTYEVTFAPETLVSAQRFEGSNRSGLHLVWTDRHTQLPDVLVDVSALRTMIVEQAVTSEIQVRSNLQRTSREVRGDIQNIGNVPITDALLLAGNTVEPLGTILPGSTREIVMQTGLDNFPHGAQVATEGLFNRQEMLTTVFFTNIFSNQANPAGPGVNPNQNSPDNQDVYLLIWSDQPAIDAQINTMAEESQGITLYIVRLKS